MTKVPRVKFWSPRLVLIDIWTQIGSALHQSTGRRHHVCVNDLKAEKRTLVSCIIYETSNL